MALSIPFAANSHASFFCFLIFVLVYSKGAAVYGAITEHNKPYHVVHVKSLEPNPYCIQSTKDQSRRESLKVVHRHGPCSRMNEDQASAPTLAEILSHDQARVESIQHRLRVQSKRHSFDDSKATLPAKPGQSIGTGNYVVTLGFGTPKRDLTLIFDTGSDVTWIQCEPCRSCYKQQEAIFNPSASQTYKNLSCATPQCSQLDFSGCTRATNTCVYAVLYGDRSFTIGLYATETLTLTPSDVFPGFNFGCGLNNTGLFRGAAGLLGLGHGPPSLVAQTSSKYGSYFSYCLPTSSSESGTLVFGKGGGTTNSAGIKYTPLLTKSDPSLYFIEVVGIEVSGQSLPIAQTVFSSSSAGTVIDSGTVITRLQPEAYDALRTRFRQLMMNYTMAQGVLLFDTCYDFSGLNTVSIPKINFLFSGNVQVPIDLSGILYPVGSSTFCLAFAGNGVASAVGIFGNTQQQTLDVVYDVAGGKIGFGTGGCS